MKKSIKEFIASNLFIDNDLSQISNKYGLELMDKSFETPKNDKVYYPQFSIDIRKEAEEMATHYQVFYCLENSIRSLISERLIEEKGNNWWEDRVPEDVKRKVVERMKKEIKDAVTIRSTKHIDYTTFGELGEIIKSNWKIFSDTFSDIKAIEAVLNRLNTVRAPIAHCCPLKEDEIVRLNLSVRDFYRTME